MTNDIITIEEQNQLKQYNDDKETDEHNVNVWHQRSINNTYNIKDYKYTNKQLLFCSYYTNFWEDTRLNATKSYMKAYSVNYELANVAGHLNIVKLSIQGMIKHKLQKQGINKDVLSEELNKVVLQDENLPAKVQAIKEWHRVLWIWWTASTEWHRDFWNILKDVVEWFKDITQIEEQRSKIKRR